ncbi:MAG: hypothetical protein PVH21_16835, partial [Myxococcales bacterium]
PTPAQIKAVHVQKTRIVLREAARALVRPTISTRYYRDTQPLPNFNISNPLRPTPRQPEFRRRFP